MVEVPPKKKKEGKAAEKKKKEEKEEEQEEVEEGKPKGGKNEKNLQAEEHEACHMAMRSKIKALKQLQLTDMDCVVFYSPGFAKPRIQRAVKRKTLQLCLEDLPAVRLYNPWFDDRKVKGKGKSKGGKARGKGKNSGSDGQGRC